MDFASFPRMLRYRHDGFAVLIRPIHLPDYNRWQVRFYIAPDSLPPSNVGKLFAYPESYESESKAIKTSIEIAKNLIEGELPGLFTGDFF